ncbi:3-oxoacyl-(acyl-carrier-protein) synthase [Prauserella isguenensis]|uniref:3-oxoacyl-(Acyl-carrier-protein) synthase n=1 Tax=Prauserella isguenensis TaxID=1470180 RepID=A0A839RZ30_9PSEU|nr:polyketide synthase [Prauserella isguenensis]MBB3050422.1 3-oxoacyl-(acyl-carrier-protein) synthase [Prauserella isguenensis]
MSPRAQVVGTAVVPAAEAGDKAELLRRNRIPPNQAISVGPLQQLALRAAEECLAAVALTDEDRARTAVFVGVTGNHVLQRRNALRIAAGQAPAWGEHGAEPDAAVDAACEVFGAGPHDKIGEMASSVPSRIAIAHRLGGRVLSLDAHEATGAVGLWHARHCVTAGAASAVLLVLVDEDETNAARTAFYADTGRPGEFRQGRAVAMLLRPEGADAAGGAVVDEIRFDRRSGGGVHGYAAAEPEDLDTWLEGIVPDTGDFALRGDDFLPAAARSHTLATARHRPSGRTAAGSVRVTDTMLDLVDAAEDCRTEQAVLTLLGTASTALAAVMYRRAGSDDSEAAAPRDRPAVVVDGAGAWFGDRQGLDGFRELSVRGQPCFDDLGHRVPAHMRSEGRIRLGRAYSHRGASTELPDGVDPVRHAALETCREAVSRSASDLSGRGLVLVATPLGPAAGRLCDADSDETASALDAVAGRIGAGPEAAAEARKWLAAFAERSGAAAQSLGELHSASIAGFVAEELGLDALPVAVEAACASALAAVDVAVGALRAGDVDYAVVCGVEFPTSCRDLALCSALGMLSTTALTAFGAAADGFLPGDGAGALVLVRSDRLGAAGAGGATTGIRGIGGSCDAHSMLAPSAAGQTAAMSAALADADVSPASMAFIETHGTGTLRGDAIELESIRTAYGAGSIALSAVKSLVGHTFAAAGIAGLLRAVTALEDGVVPPSAGLSDEDAARLADDGFLVSPVPQPFRAEPGGRTTTAAVSSFGTGGINYHIVVDRSET